MACPCTVLDIDAIAAAYYGIVAQQKETPEMTQPTEPEVTTPEESVLVFWIGDPDVTSVSVGAIDNIPVGSGSVDLPASVGLYLIGLRPDLFSPIPRQAATDAEPEDSTPVATVPSFDPIMDVEDGDPDLTQE